MLRQSAAGKNGSNAAPSLTFAYPFHLLVKQSDHVPVGILPSIGLDPPPHVIRILPHLLLHPRARRVVRVADLLPILILDEEVAVVLADQFSELDNACNFQGLANSLWHGLLTALFPSCVSVNDLQPDSPYCHTAMIKKVGPRLCDLISLPAFPGRRVRVNATLGPTL